MATTSNSKMVGARLPMDQYIEVLQSATANGLTVSEYLILKLFGNTPPKKEAGGTVRPSAPEYQKAKKELLKTIHLDSETLLSEADYFNEKFGPDYAWKDVFFAEPPTGGISKDKCYEFKKLVDQLHKTEEVRIYAILR